MRIIGYAYDGAMYCPDCAKAMGITQEEECNPMFSSDEVLTDQSCDSCGDEIALAYVEEVWDDEAQD